MNIFIKRKKSTIFSIITFCDIIVIGCWMLYFQPSPDMTIALIYFVPLVIFLNLIIAGVMFFINKFYTRFFLFNAFLSSVILIFLFDWFVEVNLKKEIESWDFRIDNIGYYVYYRPLDGDNIYFVNVSCGKGCSAGYDRGTVKEQNDTVYFFSVDSTQYYIYKDYLYNFKNIEKIKVKKIY